MKKKIALFLIISMAFTDVMPVLGSTLEVSEYSSEVDAEQSKEDEFLFNDGEDIERSAEEQDEEIMFEESLETDSAESRFSDGEDENIEFTTEIEYAEFPVEYEPYDWETQDNNITENDIPKELLFKWNINLEKHRADTLADYSSEWLEEYMIRDRPPAEELLALLETDDDFKTAVSIWKYATFDPSNLAEDQMDEIKCYEIILINMLNVATKSDKYLDTVTSDTTQSMLSLMSEGAEHFSDIMSKDIMDQVKRRDFRNLGKWSRHVNIKDLADSDKSVLEYIADNEIERMGVPAQALEYVGNFMDVSTTVYDYFCKILTYSELVNTNQNMVALLDEMQRRCPASNVKLKTAIAETKTLCKKTMFSSALIAAKGVAEFGNLVYKTSVNGMWTEIVRGAAGGFAAAPLISREFSKALVDIIFGTDKTMEQYHLLKSYVEILNMTEDICLDMQKKYKADRSLQNARSYLSSFDLFFSAKACGCDYGKDYAEVVLASGWRKLLSNVAYKKYVAKCANIKKNYMELHNSITHEEWIGYLDDYYPGFYNELIKVLETKINFEKQKVPVYIKKPFLLKAKVIGMNKDLVWKSSNEAIASVDQSGKVTGKKEGTCDITVSLYGIQKAICKITVIKPSIKLDKTKMTLNTNGSSAYLKATVKGPSTKVTWKSSNTSVAGVSTTGKVVPRKAGTATISATANGLTAKCTVTVKVKSSKKLLARKAYKELISKYEKKYGTAKTRTGTGISLFWSGVCFCRLLDFNEDGIEELVLAYQAEKVDDNKVKYYVEMWTYEGTKAKRIISFPIHTGNNYWAFGAFGIVKYSGKYYLDLPQDGNGKHYYYGSKSNGELGAIKKFVWKWKDYYYNGYWECNGKRITDEEFFQWQRKMETNKTIYLFYSKSDMGLIQKEISNVKRLLG